MVFTPREAGNAFKHISLKWGKLIFKRPETFHLTKYTGSPIVASRFTSWDGRLANCPVCGYAMIRAELKDGWSLDICSAMPSLPPFESEEFTNWLRSLPEAKLPTSCV